MIDFSGLRAEDGPPQGVVFRFRALVDGTRMIEIGESSIIRGNSVNSGCPQGPEAEVPSPGGFGSRSASPPALRLPGPMHPQQEALCSAIARQLNLILHASLLRVLRPPRAE